MKITKSLLLTIALFSPAISYAVTTKDQAARQIINSHQQAVQQHASGQNRELPAITPYRYGMKLDIAKVIHKSPSPKLCRVVPQLMTYENSRGEWNTLKYQVWSGCLNKNG